MKFLWWCITLPWRAVMIVIDEYERGCDAEERREKALDRLADEMRIP